MMIVKCIVKDCKDHNFVGDFCAACYEFITTGEGTQSQLYSNVRYEAVVKECLAECYTKSSSDVAELAVQQVYERIKKKFGLK
jgi:hypothetical protein